MLPLPQLISKCKKAGLKLTPQRLAIFKALENNKTHPTVETLYQKLKKDFPTMSLTTVYNTLETLYKLGEIAKLDIDYEKAHFDPNTSTHHHFICEKCGKIEDIMINFDSILKDPEIESRNFQIKQYNINFRGTCSNCVIKN